MTAFKEVLTNNVALTISLASLTNNSARESTAIDNTGNLDFDANVFLKIKSPASGTSATGYVNIYAYGSADGGTTYPDNVTGTDAAITLVVPPNVKLIGVMNLVANATTYKAGPFSIAAAFGYLPGKWGIIVENKTGGTLDTTEGNHAKFFERVQSQGV
jgi:hypothetical protein